MRCRITFAALLVFTPVMFTPVLFTPVLFAPVLVAPVLVAPVLSTAVLSTAALAHDNGQFGNVPPEIRAWFKSVKSHAGVPCCDIADGHRTDYDMRESKYWVPINGEWMMVPPEAVVEDFGQSDRRRGRLVQRVQRQRLHPLLRPRRRSLTFRGGRRR